MSFPENSPLMPDQSQHDSSPQIYQNHGGFPPVPSRGMSTAGKIMIAIVGVLLLLFVAGVVWGVYAYSRGAVSSDGGTGDLDALIAIDDMADTTIIDGQKATTLCFELHVPDGYTPKHGYPMDAPCDVEVKTNVTVNDDPQDERRVAIVSYMTGVAPVEEIEDSFSGWIKRGENATFTDLTVDSLPAKKMILPAEKPDETGSEWIIVPLPEPVFSQKGEPLNAIVIMTTEHTFDIETSGNKSFLEVLAENLKITATKGH